MATVKETNEVLFILVIGVRVYLPKKLCIFMHFQSETISFISEQPEVVRQQYG